MKKLLLILLVVLLGLQVKSQIIPCDSIEYTFQSNWGSTSLMLHGTANIPGTIDWSWQVCNTSLCYSDTGASVVFNQFTAQDTLKVCYMVFLDINGTTWTCQKCDSLIYDWSYGWILMNMGNPLAIEELKPNTTNYKTYDLLGRELFEIPKGTIYIKNRKKFIR
jgi:hypothetical protein